MKFILAPDKFKGSLSGKQFCDAVEKGIKKALPQAMIQRKPLADGGDGTLEVVKPYLDASVIEVEVSNPLFYTIKASYLYAEDKKIAFVEMSEASGYKLLNKSERNCMGTTSLGTGELILDALDRGATQIVLGIGGSATNDGGMGVGVALGYRFLDNNGEALSPIGEHLLKVQQIDSRQVDKRLSKVEVKVACDVDNPFYGPEGAAFVYAPQKGANRAEVEHLDAGLKHFAQLLQKTFGTEVQEIPGAGAAGGLGGGAIVFLGASLISGIDFIKEIANFNAALMDADWVVTGEGKLDAQTLSGKTIAGVVTAAKKHDVPVAALCGIVEIPKEVLTASGISYAVGISEGILDMDVAYRDAAKNLEEAAYTFAKTLTGK